MAHLAVVVKLIFLINQSILFSVFVFNLMANTLFPLGTKYALHKALS